MDTNQIKKITIPLGATILQLSILSYKRYNYEQKYCPLGRWKSRRWRECWEEKEDNIKTRPWQTVRSCFQIGSGQQGFVRSFNLGTSASSVRVNIAVKIHYCQAANPMFLSCLIPSGPKPSGRTVSIIYQSSSLLRRKFCGALRLGLAREHGTVLSKKNKEKNDENMTRNRAKEDKLKTYGVKIP